MTKSKGVGRGCHLKPERKELLTKLVQDGWPMRQMRLTHGFGYDTVKAHYPDYQGMSLSEAGKLGRQMERTAKEVTKIYGRQQPDHVLVAFLSKSTKQENH